MGIKRILLYACINVAVLISVLPAGNCQPTESTKPSLVIFHSPSCHSCIKVKQEIIPKIEKAYKDRIVLEYRDIDDLENYTLFLSIQKQHRVVFSGSLPVFYMSGRFINGYERIKDGWESFINDALKLSYEERPEALPAVDLISRFRSFKPEIIMGAGFIDGLNPCAFTVIVFFMSFMAVQGYKRRELIGIGISFIFAVFITYLLIGIGVFGFFYRFNHLWLMVRVINYTIGTVSIILGILAVYDFIAYMKSGRTEGLILQLPKSIKNQIHKVIGLYGRVSNRSAGIASDQRSFYRVIVSAFITGFLISLLEAVCTGQAYLPTISFILKTSPLKSQAMGYLLLYNAMFVAPLLAVFVFALLGVTSARFSIFFKKYILLIKILMAALFFGFGGYLIWRA